MKNRLWWASLVLLTSLVTTAHTQSIFHQYPPLKPIELTIVKIEAEDVLSDEALGRVLLEARYYFDQIPVEVNIKRIVKISEVSDKVRTDEAVFRLYDYINTYRASGLHEKREYVMFLSPSFNNDAVRYHGGGAAENCARPILRYGLATISSRSAKTGADGETLSLHTFTNQLWHLLGARRTYDGTLMDFGVLGLVRGSGKVPVSKFSIKQIRKCQKRKLWTKK